MYVIPTLAEAEPSRRQCVTAVAVALAFALVTAGFGVFAAQPWPEWRAFVPAYAALTAGCYVLLAYMVASEFLATGGRSLLYVAGGGIWTALIVALQLMTVPGMFGEERLVGGSQSTIHLWMWWHVGPPIYAMLYSIAERRARAQRIDAVSRPWGLLAMLGFTLAAFVIVLALVTRFHDALPVLNQGADFRRINSTGVAPAILLFTAFALAALWITTRLRTMLQLWLAVSLFALVCDNVITMLGGVRGSVGWYVGRLEALASAAILVVAYVNQMRELASETARSASAAATAADELRRAADAQRAAEAATEQRRRLEAIGEVAGGVAHDFNNLLYVLNNNVALMRRQAHGQALVSSLEACERTIARGREMVKGILAFARHQPLELRSIDVNAFLREMEHELRSVAPAHRVEFALSEDVWPLLADSEALGRAVINLLSNARDATPAGGVITVETRNAAAGEAAGRTDGEFVSIIMRDTGSGMGPEVAARAWEPFFTTKGAGKGTGLGLAITYGFAKQCGGEATIDSAPGRGTAVTIYLPKGTPAQRYEAAPPDTNLVSLRVAERR